MAHHKSAIKRIRQNIRRNIRNKAKRTKIRKLIKDVRVGAFQKMAPVIDQMAAERILHKNKAARTKSRLNRQIRLMEEIAE